MEELKILLLCSNNFALPVLHTLVFFKNLKVVAIPEHSKDLINEIKIITREEKIKILILKKKTFAKKLEEAISKYGIDTGIVASFSFRLPASVYQLPANGFFNIHPGPLPEFRGPDPVFQQIRQRKKLAGITIHKLNEEFDCGPVVIKEMIKLEPSDTFGIVTDKLSILASQLLTLLLKMIAMKVKVPEKKQDEAKAVYYKKQDRFDVMLNWRIMEPEYILALMNACNPWNKGAVCKLNNKVIHLVNGEIVEFQFPEGTIPGTILSVDERGMMVASINNKAVIIKTVYCDAGIFPAGSLNAIGIFPGMQFSILGNSTT
jgi:methionyl-tRNA formyltransferase